MALTATNDTTSSYSMDMTTSATPLLDALWKWLLDEPWRVAIVAGIPCVLIVLISIAIACCMTKRRGYYQASTKDTADEDADSKGLPSVVNGALEMITIVPSETATMDGVEEAAAEHQTTAEESAHSPMGESLNLRSFLGERDETSIGGPPVSPTTGSPSNEDHPEFESSLFPKPRSFKQHRTSSTSSQQRTLAYIEVELNPVTEKDQDVIISTEKPTQYVEIAGVYKPFCPK